MRTPNRPAAKPAKPFKKTFKSSSNKDNSSYNKDKKSDFSEKPKFRRDSDDKPKFKKDFGDKPFEKPKFRRDSEEKPKFKKSFGDKPFEKPKFKRDFEEKPRFKKDFEASEKPKFKRDFEDKPAFKRNFDDKPSEKRPRFKPSSEGKPFFKRNDDDRKPVVERSRNHDADYDPNAKYSLKKQIEFKRRTLHENSEIRLNRFLANAGICSRREADEYIKAGVVSVNGQVVTEMGTKVSFNDKVLFHDQLVRSEKKVYILLNKPKDCLTTSDDPQERHTVMDLIKDACTERVYPVGRLDRNTTGVLLLTNDGDLAARLMHPKYNKKKIYHVFLDKALTKADMETIAGGIALDDGEIRADNISYVDETDKKQVGIEIHSGRNRIVRRIFEHLGYRVERLDRVYFAGLTKKNLQRGKYRFLSEKEVSMLSMGAYE
ncbi:MAG: rRNA pseudouridine synthase [Prevotellaceae bacterium]|jgi:23S rRNA pseudouridine2605 synthase|nr:rRNA pseudouridine synthase [Prevotellaceae bacterium]